MKKKVAALLISFVVACSCIVSWIPQPANAVFLKDYMEQYRKEHTFRFLCSSYYAER